MVIRRDSLREQIRHELLERIRTGKVQPGQGINEVQLAADLGVSRTPLREALIVLEQTGHIDSQSGRGFSFKPFRPGELSDIAPILATLEGLALDQSPSDKLSEIGHELLAKAHAFTDETVSLRKITDNDDKWHELLLAACPNEVLLDLIHSTRQLFHRYEALVVRHESMVERVSNEHIAIAEALVEGDIERAKLELQRNWLNGAKRLQSMASSV